MKKGFALFVCLFCVGFAEAPLIEMPPAHYLVVQSPSHPSFTYVSFGGGSFAREGLLSRTSLLRLAVTADVSLGKRHLYGYHALDYNIGMNAGVLLQCVYGQASYLYYPGEFRGAYFGAGLTLDVCLVPLYGGVFPFPNLPLTAGYQTLENQFFQMQYGCLNQSIIASNGISF